MENLSMRRLFAIALVAATLQVQLCWAGGGTDPSDSRAQDSYSLGYGFAENLMKDAVEPDRDLLLQGIRDALDGREPTPGRKEMREALQGLQSRITIKNDQRFRELAARNLEAGRKFLESNGKKQGVRTLPSRLQYEVLRAGTGETPKAADWVAVHYRGTLISGEEFDNSYVRGQPATIRVGTAIPGWAEALQFMRTGSRWRIFVPADLAYGEHRFGRIPPNSALVFEIELLRIGPDPESPARFQTESKPTAPDASGQVR